MSNLNKAEIFEAIELMRKIGVDLQQYEVKSAAKSLPKDIGRTVSAFSNGSGGTIILGLAEGKGFAPVKDLQVGKLQDALADVCSQKMTPPVRPNIQVLEFEGFPILVAQIPEKLPRDKPCYITASNLYQGSYIRTGDGDRRMSSYEINRLMDERQQPRYDAEVVDTATIDDLDPALVSALLARERKIHARNFANLEDLEALQRLNILAADGDGLRPTLAGLLAIGKYPQQFFPRLCIAFAVYPGTNKAEVTRSGLRLLDSQTIVGPIPAMIEDCISAIMRNMRMGAIVHGSFRKNIPDYPIVALREAIVNALMHRDYSPESHGTPVQVDLFPDRLEISNPGGLFGNVTIDTLGKGISSSRNQFLANILENTPYEDGLFVAENRGTGYQVIEKSLADALMPAPLPHDSILSFSLTFMKRRLTSSEQESNNQENVQTIILDLLENQPSVSTTEVSRYSGKSRATVLKTINSLIEDGILERTETRGSTKQRYRLVKQRKG